MPPVLILENRRESPLNCPKDETGWVIFHWLHSGRGMFLPGDFKGSLMREGFKSALWKCCSQDRYDSQRLCFFQAMAIFALRIKCCMELCHSISWDSISSYNQSMQLWAAAKKRWLHPGLSQLAPHFYLCSGGHAAMQLKLIQRKGKNCIKYKLKPHIWAAPSCINWGKRGLKMDKLFLKTSPLFLSLETLSIPYLFNHLLLFVFW